MKVLKAHNALREGHKIRSLTWYWGKYIHLVKGKLVNEDGKPYLAKYIPSEFEIYIEEQHGTHNATGKSSASI